MHDMAYGYISKVVFNDGTQLVLNNNDIVVLVGPNNAGKSQALKDIYDRAKEGGRSIVVSAVETNQCLESVEECLDKLAPKRHEWGDRIKYQLIGGDVGFSPNDLSRMQQNKQLGDFRNLFVARLDTAARLGICHPQRIITRTAPKSHPIHYAAFDHHFRKWLSENFKKAFGVEITPNTQFGENIPLCIGDAVHLEGNFEDEQTRLEAYAAILEKYKQVQNQGDGIKSFTGILLYLMLDYYCVYLIDEPESFLHPPQARIMGQIIGQTLVNGKQAFISTHSEDIIRGLMDVCPERIKLVRITRNDNTNAFSILNNDKFNAVWNDPLLRYSNIMTGLFHKSVVLCESDSDCKMYSIIEQHLKQTDGRYSETLFIYSGGKHRIAKIAEALKSLNIDIKIIVDIDVLNEETVFRGIIETASLRWDDLSPLYNKIVSNLHSAKEFVIRENAKVEISRILDSGKLENLSRKEIDGIRDVVSTISPWSNLKMGGKSALPAGDASAAFDELDKKLCAAGIFIVPCGELECFVKSTGGHGPEWVNKVLEAHPDLSDSVYDAIKEFIKTMSL